MTPTPAPSIQDLLPPEMLQRCLDLWLHTGVNLMHDCVSEMLASLDMAEPGSHWAVLEAMETDVMDKLNEVRRLWDERRAAK